MLIFILQRLVLGHHRLLLFLVVCLLRHLLVPVRLDQLLHLPFRQGLHSCLRH
jgi:hypothetical protein